MKTTQRKAIRLPRPLPIVGTIDMATGKISLNPLGMVLLAKRPAKRQPKPAA